MKRLITAAEVFVALAVISTLAWGTQQIINYDEKMVGANHPTLSDTLNRGFLINHSADGTHQDNIITPGKLQSSSGTADNTTYYRGDGTWATPPGETATTTLPWDNITSRPTINGVTVTGAVLDNESNYPAALARLAGPTFTGTVTMPAWIMFGTDNVSANQNLRTTDNQVANTYTASEFISTALDNARGFAAPNTADPTGANLEAGLIWVTDNCTKTRSNDNTVTYSAGCLIKTFAFGIDNVVDGDDILLWKVPRALTILQVDCYASTDNVVGVLQECTAGDVTSCTDVDDTDWTITNATSGFSVNSGFENAGIAAGAWLKWVTTSEGTTNSNKLSCTVQYRE